MSDEDWVKAAMADDSIVGELLVRLNHTLPPPPPPPKRRHTPPLPLYWSVRQRRSRTMILPAKKPVSTRASPTTPLSWSGATSVSGGGAGGFETVDGFEEASRPPTNRCSGLSRSKVIGTTETTSSKRPRKKKTLAELKVEEDLLLKERKYLKRKLESLRITLEKQRTENESLKLMKRDLPSQPEGKIVTTVASDYDETISGKNQQCDASVAFPKPLISKSSFEVPKEVVHQENNNNFALPDLNLPIEEDFS